MFYREIEKDLFEMGRGYVLAHCISEDCIMGAGIARVFRDRYPDMRGRLLENNPVIGDALGYESDRYIYSIITKEKYWHKPSYKTFEAGILSLKEGMVREGFKKLAIPQLGAGLDRLDWDKNREIIKRIFRGTGIEVTVCILR